MDARFVRLRYQGMVLPLSSKEFYFLIHREPPTGKATRAWISVTVVLRFRLIKQSCFLLILSLFLYIMFMILILTHYCPNSAVNSPNEVAGWVVASCSLISHDAPLFARLTLFRNVFNI
jgi:succinate-acetate transporter protein